MKIEYEWTRENLKEKLKSKRVVPNTVFLMLGALFYLYFTYYGIVGNDFDTLILIVGFACYFLGMVILLFIMTHIHVFMKLRRNDRQTSKAYGTYYIEANETEIKSTINENTIIYKWKDINKFKQAKKWFFIATPKDRIGLLFGKENIGEKEYDKLLKYVKQRMNGEEV